MKLATDQDVSSARVAPREVEVVLPEAFDLTPTPIDAEPRDEPTIPAAYEQLQELRDEPAERAAPRTTDRPAETARERQLRAARDEERGKRKRLADAHRVTLAENAALRAKAAATPASPAAFLARETPDQRHARRLKLTKLAAEKDTIAEVVDILTDDFDTRLDARVNDFNQALDTTAKNTAALVDERVMRALKPDYDEVLTRAGIWDAIRIDNGVFRDPAMARAIYSSPNFAEAAYKAALQKLAFEDDERERGGERRDDERPSPTDATGQTPEAIAEAEQRGRKQAFDTVADETHRGRGIRQLPGTSGPRRAAITKEFLDDLMHKNFPAYEALLKQNPPLETFHLSD